MKSKQVAHETAAAQELLRIIDVKGAVVTMDGVQLFHFDAPLTSRKSLFFPVFLAGAWPGWYLDS